MKIVGLFAERYERCIDSERPRLTGPPHCTEAHRTLLSKDKGLC